MKKNTFFLISLILIFFVFPNNKIYSSATNKIIAKVDNQIISSYELKEKIKIILFLSKQELNQTNINQTKKMALRTLVDYKLKKREILDRNIPVQYNEDVKNYLKNISLNFNTDEKGFEKLLNQNNIDYELYLNEIKHEFTWQRLIYRMYKNKINIDEQEIVDELNNFMLSQKNLETFQLAEIEILAVNKIENKKNIEEIQEQIQSIGFSDTAVKYSQSSSSLSGGNIGWVNSKSLSKNILAVVENLKIEETSKPFFQTDSIVFLKLLNKKKKNINNLNINVIKTNIINSKTNELLNLFSNNHLSKIKNKVFIKFNE